MSRVRRLPEDLIDKIAAGEVVERPASVVKELVENAIDAGARTIAVEIERGGKALIRVRDDGCGMDRADAEAALERHATSKIASLADLEAVATHGFRGEALPAIASVSDLVLRTRDEGPAGTEIALRQGRPAHVRDAGHPRGTTVEVRDLFGAVPARRKFLRADSTEASHVIETVTQLALARPDLGFRLRSGGRDVIDVPPVAGVLERVFQLFGGELTASLVLFDAGDAALRVHGLVSRPAASGSGRGQLRLFVNRRAVRDRSVLKAVAQAYRAVGAADRPFDAFLFLELPAELVDVNVHPAKAEVRFAQTQSVFATVESAVRGALSEAARASVAGRPDASAEPATATDRVSEAMGRYLSRGDAGAAEAKRSVEVRSTPPGEGADAPVAVAGDRQQSLLSPGAVPSVLGQHRQTYIVATDGDELVLYDQHTSHERVRFERIVASLSGGRVESQLLIAPLVAMVPAELMPILEAHAETLHALGFEAEPFGGKAVRLRALPAVFGARDPGTALVELLRDFRERETTGFSVEGDRNRLAATLACHSAARAGEPLSVAAMAAIVRDLAVCTHPGLCPHGRPTQARLPKDEMSRLFGRSGWRRS